MILIDKDLFDFLLLLCKISERIDEQISRKAYNSVIRNVLIEKIEFDPFSYKKEILATKTSRLSTNIKSISTKLSIYDFMSKK